MADKENLDSMAKRYKEEMLRLYRRNTADTAQEQSAGQTQRGISQQQAPAVNDSLSASAAAGKDTPSVLHCDRDGCRFLSAEEIMMKESGNRPAEEKKPYCDIAVTGSGADITASLIDGVGFAGENLITSGAAGYDAPDGNNETLVSAKFEGMYIAPVFSSENTYSDDSESASRRISSGIYSDEIPDYLRLPSDSDEEMIIPVLPDSSYIVPDRWNSLTGDTGWGYVQFDVSGGKNESVIRGAAVIITRNAGDRILLSRILTTGRSGRTPTAVLPVPVNRAGNKCVPYAEYIALVYADGYRIAQNIPVKIFAGTKTIQPVYLAERTERSGE